MIKRILIKFLFPKGIRMIYETSDYQTKITVQYLWWNKILGYNKNIPWPTHPSSLITGPNNINLGIDVNPGYMPGCYIQAIGKINIGDFTQIGPNVGIITANHDLLDTRKHVVQEVKIGSYCWIGMGAIILPGVIIGDNTIIGAGSIVTKSFPNGNCIIGGNPAKVLKHLSEKSIRNHQVQHHYIGYEKLK